MALPTNPPLTLSQIRAEFGAPSTAPLSAFHRGGAYVPNISANNGVPTSGPISILDLLGATNYVPFAVELDSPGFSGAHVRQGTITRSVTILASGGSGSYTYGAAWLGTPDPFLDLSRSGNVVTVSSTYNGPDSGSVITRTGTVRITCSDGSETKTFDVPVYYEWDF